MKATLALENGNWYEGVSAGAAGQTGGEVVFNTSLTGYQEILTDPSYSGQIVTMTCPEIGNYGVADEDGESRAPKSPASSSASNRRSRAIGVQTARCANTWFATTSSRSADIDTRALTRILRSSGVMRGIIATGDVDPRHLVEQARALPQMEGSDLVVGVTCDAPFDWAPDESTGDEFSPVPERRAGRPLKVAAYDYGMKWNILRRFTVHGCDVRVFPATAPASDLLAAGPDGVFLSNGPGDPAVLDYAIENARELVKSEVPVFGICLGHQILSLALGAQTYKLKFGHRGANHPVKSSRAARSRSHRRITGSRWIRSRCRQMCA